VRLANHQADVVSRSQANGLGLSDTVISRLLRERLWHRLTDGIYSLRPHPDWEARAWAGLLLGGTGAALGGTAAAHLHQLLRQPPDLIEVWTPRAHPRSRESWVFHRGFRPSVGEPARITVPEAVLDICAGLSEDEVTALLAEALSQRRTSPETLLRALSRRARYHHRRLFVEVLGDVSEGAHSPLERRYVTQVQRAHGLPAPKQQRTVSGTHRTDGWYPEYGVIIELDGAQYHRGAAAFRDMARDNEHALIGALTLRYGWPDVTGRPCEVAAQVSEALRSRGWTGTQRPCPRCRRTPCR